MQPRPTSSVEQSAHNPSVATLLVAGARQALRSAPAVDPMRSVAPSATAASASTGSELTDNSLALIVASLIELRMADGVAVSERSTTGVTVLVSTGGAVDAAESLQADLHEGPCLDDGFIGEIRSSELDGDDRPWPTWSPAAARLGFGAVLTIRLYAVDGAVGCLTLYYRTPRTFTALDHERATVAGIHVAIELKNHRQRSQHPLAPVISLPSVTRLPSRSRFSAGSVSFALTLPTVGGRARRSAGLSHVIDLEPGPTGTGSLSPTGGRS